MSEAAILLRRFPRLPLSRLLPLSDRTLGKCVRLSDKDGREDKDFGRLDDFVITHKIQDRSWLDLLVRSRKAPSKQGNFLHRGEFPAFLNRDIDLPLKDRTQTWQTYL